MRICESRAGTHNGGRRGGRAGRESWLLRCGFLCPVLKSSTLLCQQFPSECERAEEEMAGTDLAAAGCIQLQYKLEYKL